MGCGGLTRLIWLLTRLHRNTFYHGRSGFQTVSLVTEMNGEKSQVKIASPPFIIQWSSNHDLVAAILVHKKKVIHHSGLNDEELWGLLRNSGTLSKTDGRWQGFICFKNSGQTDSKKEKKKTTWRSFFFLLFPTKTWNDKKYFSIILYIDRPLKMG